MTISDTIIANVALAELGASRITNTGDGSKNAGLVGTFLPLAKLWAYSNHDWNFATKRQSALAERTPAPVWGWEFYYAVPSDSVRIISIGKGGFDIDDDWQVEAAENGDLVICTNVSAPIDVKYIYDVTDPQKYSPSFVEYLTRVLKWKLAKPVTGKEDIKAAAKVDMDEYLKRAMNNDGAEGTPVQYGDTQLEDVR